MTAATAISTTDLYAVLGIQREATLSAVRTAYRGKVAQHHPSKGGDPAVFDSINEAYAVLINSQRRAYYDKTGEIMQVADKPISGTVAQPAESEQASREAFCTESTDGGVGCSSPKGSAPLGDDVVPLLMPDVDDTNARMECAASRTQCETSPSDHHTENPWDRPAKSKPVVCVQVEESTCETNAARTASLVVPETEVPTASAMPCDQPVACEHEEEEEVEKRAADEVACCEAIEDTRARERPASLADALSAAEAMADVVEDTPHSGLPELQAMVECNGPKVFRCSQGVLFAKKSREPTGKSIMKLSCPVGSYVHSTGRLWKGPGGGTWCELDDEASNPDKMRWMLVKGPGFGLAGPALIDASVLKAGGTYEATCLRVQHMGAYREANNRIIYESLMSKEATVWGIKKAVEEATGLNANQCYISNQLPGKAPERMNGDSWKLPVDFMKGLKDEETLRRLNGGGEDVLLYLVYTGNFEQDFKPDKALANGA